METNSPSPATPTPEASRYTLTVEEAAARFADGGIPRSLRTIQRYCKLGILDSTVIETAANEQYLIDGDSVARRIIELQQIIQTTGVETRRDVSRQDATNRDTTRHGAPHVERNGSHLDRIKELEAENENLRFDVRINRELANFVRNQNNQLISELQEQSRQIGRLETQLLALEGATTSGRSVNHSEEMHIPTEPPAPATAQEGDNQTS